MKIKISCDSTCDLSPELYAQYNVAVSPLHVMRGDEMLTDGVDITAADVIEYMDSGDGICSTSAVSIGEYEDHFAACLKKDRPQKAEQCRR